ncbi:hypothetical protein C7B65_10310 [Phormidesmis priestleyi ULC007]|uniref:DUF7734 domain-containing protein n=1 Tax=Phormidesmis priestleyi ULC007 TaxID=1920490 RepID=A0A2T1DGR7_9CYAN|nr:hypothetical protein [Phormidesmis priestleyi]PSB19678.1 hypothetical protein C7B65_10310 [Phormidesmis priestleyi ULC007]PZO53562.1 MAG: hypothetical protein DCF14_04015 [Phormidesmis priestleyi]
MSDYPPPLGRRLEQYTLKRPDEVLLVSIEVDGQPDEIAVFKGFSSSLMNPTAFDPDVPVVPDRAEILSIDRLQSPYNPNDPRYLQKGMAWGEFQSLLSSLGL